LKLKEDNTAKVEIQGYLSIGGDAKLEQQRVTKIKEYLSLKGVSLDKISIKELDNTNKLATNQIDLIISSTGDIIPTAQAKPVDPVALNPNDINNAKQVSQSVEFSLDTNITAQSKEVLNQMASVLQSNKAIAVELQGYLSPKNPDAEKEMQRVISVRNYLLEKGVQEQQIAIRPLDDNQLQAGTNTEQKVSQINKVDVIFSVAENSPNAFLSPDSDPNLLRFTSALNYLMGDEKTAKETLFKAMGITKPESQGALVDPNLFRQK
ncbi:MAG TPA: OmpA family protein, partial [Allocoleopsis sp.]